MADKPTRAQEKANKDVGNLHNPVGDKNSGRVWPIVLVIVIGSIAWIFQDPELRRGLGQLTGFHALEPIIEEVVNRDFLMTFHGTWSSSCTQRALVAALEKDLEYELKLVNMTANGHKSAQHKHMHPFGQIPVLEVAENSYIYESRAIASYFERKYPERGHSFAVNGLIGNVYYEQALSVEAFDFDPLAAAVYREAVMLPAKGLQVNERVLNASLTSLASKLDAYEIILASSNGGEGKYLAGHNLTLADLYHLPLGQKLVDSGYGTALTDAEKRPNVARWWNLISSRKSWQTVLHDVKAYEEEQKKIVEERKRQEELEKEAEEAFHHHDDSAAEKKVAEAKEEIEEGSEKKHKKHHGIFH